MSFRIIKAEAFCGSDIDIDLLPVKFLGKIKSSIAHPNNFNKLA
jgi:hypothetical protein